MWRWVGVGRQLTAAAEVEDGVHRVGSTGRDEGTEHCWVEVEVEVLDSVLVAAAGSCGGAVVVCWSVGSRRVAGCDCATVSCHSASAGTPAQLTRTPVHIYRLSHAVDLARSQFPLFSSLCNLVCCARPCRTGLEVGRAEVEVDTTSRNTGKRPETTGNSTLLAYRARLGGVSTAAERECMQEADQMRQGSERYERRTTKKLSGVRGGSTLTSRTALSSPRPTKLPAPLIGSAHLCCQLNVVYVTSRHSADCSRALCTLDARTASLIHSLVLPSALAPDRCRRLLPPAVSHDSEMDEGTQRA